ncbi:hypothetical protein KFL_000560040 [Klebsormidium nitens]|uniref:Uncharacterized protein n=1 Tax=Klebsormidium nitens TaxID=105231 RepID=A0A1Y1HPF2_KLENI|nr:hypothetical protein KFL_000560040 [Klebsormidium nitens]|eukprot:GAQ80514.1 hypothetical protein KFL_000560040 [Klebsormidium nitens]
MPRFCEAIPIVPSHLLTDNCTAANAEYYSEQPPGSFFFYTGTPDSYCSRASTPTTGWKICGASSAPSCTTVVAPYGSKADACKAQYSYVNKCSLSVRVFFINYDLDCDWVIICEYFDGPVVVTIGSAAPSIVAAPPTKGTAGAPLLAPVPLFPPSPSLLPKAGDVVMLLSYAAGSVDYYCNKASGLFSDGTISANLYTSPLGNASIGTYLKANGSQVFTLADGSIALTGPRDSGNSYPQNPNLPLDGGYGSLNQSYSTATGNLSLADVAYVTVTATVGGVLPSKAPCSKVLGSLIPYRPWSIPFEANITFFSRFVPPP